MIFKKTIAIFMSILMLTIPMVFSVTIVPGSTQVIDVTDSSATVTWRTNLLSDGKVEYGQSITNMKLLPETGAVKTEHSVDISGLSYGQKYFFRAISEDGNGPTSSDYYDFTTKLPAPSGLRQNNLKYNSVDLNWNKITNAVKYKVYKDGVMVTELTENTYSLTSLMPETDYSIEVSVIDGVGRESEKSEALTFTTPAKSINITFIQAASITNVGAKISWVTDEAIACKLSYDTDTSLDVQIDTVASISHSVTLSNLNANTRYYYQIQCKDTLSSRLYFQTLDVEPTFQITNIAVSEITKNSAKVTWETNSEAGSKIMYSMDDSFNQIKSSIDGVLSHEFLLDNLNSGAKYYFKVESDDITSAFQTFDTIESLTQNFLILNPIPDITNNRSVEISGKSRINSRVYIFVNDKEIAQIRQKINGTQFSFNVVLEPNSAYEDTFGRNFIKIYSWDENGNKDEKSFYVTLDTTPPDLILFDFPEYTKENKLIVNGMTDVDSSLQFFINEIGQGEFNANENGSFSHELNLGNEGEYNFTVVSTDSAGNEKKILNHIIVDRTAPPVEWLSDFNKATHFKLFKVKGKTDPGAQITVINFGHYSGYCGDQEIKTKYGGCEKFVQDQETHTKLMSIIDPVSFGLGMKIITTADDNGEFEVTVSLIPNEMNKISVNHILFNVTDKAGLTTEKKESIRYEPGCGDWYIGNIESFPFNIYTRELFAGGIDAVAFFPIYYMGTGTPEVTSIHISKDDSNHGYLMADEDELSNLFDIGTGSKATAYDVENSKLMVQIPITIKRYAGSIDKLPGTDTKAGQINAHLGVRLSYGVDGQEANCEIYPTVAFALNKPMLTTKWLSPTMINSSIKNLNKLINGTEFLIDKLQIALTVGLITCGAFIAIDYIKGFGSSSREVGDDGCTSVQEGMKKTYYVCDRILCPNVPHECNYFKAEGSAEYDAQAKINRDWKDKYNDRSNDDAQKNFTEWLDENEGLIKGNYKELTPEEIPKTFTYDPKKESDDQRKVTIKYVGVDENGKVTDPEALQVYSKKDEQYIVASEALLAAKDCVGGTLIEYKIIDDSNSKAGYVRVGEEIESAQYQCVKEYTPSEMGTPDTSKVIQGCYDDTCPQFDDTKCFGTDGIMPPEGLWSSMKCGCIPGMKSHLQNWLKIMINAKRCLEEALVGEVRGAFCERLLSQFICDILIELFRLALSFANDSNVEGGADLSGGIRGSLTNYKTNSKDVSEGLSDRYGDIVKSKMQMSSDQIVNKACMVAFTGDWTLLDGMLNTIVDSVEVKPMAYIMAKSRPFAPDLFSGKTNFNYDISIFLVPGGETYIKVWLECDKSYPDGDFCGLQSDKSDAPKVPGVPSHLRKNDPALSQNYMFTDQNALEWYNKVVMQLDYEIGGKPQREFKYATINHRGDLSSGCTFSVTGGITCEIFKQISPMGIVELYSSSQGSKLSPSVSVYENGDSVNALITMRNSYVEDFYLIAQYPDGTKQEYTLKGGTDSSSIDLQTYNIWLDSVTFDGGSSGAIDQEVNIQLYNIKTDEEKQNKYFGIQLPPQIMRMDAKIHSQIEFEGKMEKIIPYDCTLFNIDEINKVSEDLEKYNKEFRFGKYIDGKMKYMEKDNTNYNRITTENYYLCMMIHDELNLENGGPIQLDDDSKIEIEKITLKNPLWIESADQTLRVPIKFYGLSNNYDKQDITFKEGTSSGSRSKTITLNVYEDTDDNEHGDSPIVYSGGPGDQVVSFTYRYGIPVDSNPRFDIVEPPGKYMNNDGKPVPIAINAWNAENIDIKIKPRSGEECIFKVSKPFSSESEVSGCGKLVLGNKRTTYGSSNAPPFIEYLWDYPKNDNFPTGPTDIYDIEIIVKNKEGKEVKRGKPVSFGSSNNKIKQEDLLVCLGSGICSGLWVAPKPTGEILGNYNSSSMPTVTS